MWFKIWVWKHDLRYVLMFYCLLGLRFKLWFEKWHVKLFMFYEKVCVKSMIMKCKCIQCLSMKHDHRGERNAEDTIRIKQVSSMTWMDKSVRISPRCCEKNDNDVMKDKSLEGVSCKLSLPRGKPHNVKYVYTKGYRWSCPDKS
jgi:hypothetical protein